MSLVVYIHPDEDRLDGRWYTLTCVACRGPMAWEIPIFRPSTRYPSARCSFPHRMQHAVLLAVEYQLCPHTELLREEYFRWAN